MYEYAVGQPWPLLIHAVHFTQTQNNPINNGLTEEFKLHNQEY